MADVAMWTDKKVKAAFEAKARARLEELQAELEGQDGRGRHRAGERRLFCRGHAGQGQRSGVCTATPTTGSILSGWTIPEAAIALPTW